MPTIRTCLRALCVAGLVPLIAGCGAPLHGTDAGAQVATATPKPPRTPYEALAQPTHYSMGPMPTIDPTCASAASVDIAPGRPPDNKLPDYGFGPGPVYLTGQIIDYRAVWVAVGQEADLVVAPRYTGAVTVRGHRLGGTGQAEFAGNPSVTIASSPPASYWRYWEGMLRFDQPGCYQLDITGPGLHETVVVQAATGQPPPG